MSGDFLLLLAEHAAAAWRGRTWSPGRRLRAVAKGGMDSKLQVLCLHGSHQDAEVFRQRLEPLRRKLSGLANLHFPDAPHELPLQDGQSVAMRTWWRHPHLDAQQHQEQQGQQPQPQYDGRMLPDWQASLAALQAAWEKHGGFDVILGFSNGAAAAFLLAAHVAAGQQAAGEPGVGWAAGWLRGPGPGGEAHAAQSPASQPVHAAREAPQSQHHTRCSSSTCCES